MQSLTWVYKPLVYNSQVPLENPHPCGWDVHLWQRLQLSAGVELCPMCNFPLLTLGLRILWCLPKATEFMDGHQKSRGASKPLGTPTSEKGLFN